MITSRVVSATISMMDKLFLDPNLYRDVTWKKFVSSTYNSSLGYNVDSYTETSLKGVKLDNTRNTWPSGYPSGFDGSGLEAGDTVFFFKTSELPSSISIRDMIIEGTISYRVKSIIPIVGVITQVNVQGI